MSIDMRSILRNFILEKLRQKGDMQKLSDSDSLFISMRLDSLDAVNTVVFLEKNFGINFIKIGFDQSFIDSINAMAELITRQTT